MTTFIFEQRKPFFGSNSQTARVLALFFAVIFVCAHARGANAGRPSAAKDRTQGDTLYQQAFAAYQAGDYPQAQSLIEKADVLKPDQPDGWNLRGMVYLKQNAFDKAESAFARAVVLDPKLWAAQFNLAEAPFQGKDYALARSRFEKLLNLTDRYKEAKQWELVQYKAFLSCLLMGDNAGAMKKLGKLPDKGAATPAFQYAQASLAFNHKDAVAARRSLAAAQTAFSPLLNGLFSDSLVEVGWESPMPPPPELAANGPIVIPSASGMPSAENHAPIVIDPRLEASAAEPLPAGGDSAVHPVLSKLGPARPAAATVHAPAAPAHTPTPPPELAEDHRELLLE